MHTYNVQLIYSLFVWYFGSLIMVDKPPTKEGHKMAINCYREKPLYTQASWVTIHSKQQPTYITFGFLTNNYINEIANINVLQNLATMAIISLVMSLVFVE